eukprot:2677612-Alexandrium_andersonii.AAC.1
MCLCVRVRGCVRELPGLAAAALHEERRSPGARAGTARRAPGTRGRRSTRRGPCRLPRRPAGRSPGTGTFWPGATAAPGQGPGGARPKG